MDGYYSSLARYTLVKAGEQVVIAQDNLLNAGAPDWMQMRASKILSAIRNLEREILKANQHQFPRYPSE